MLQLASSFLSKLKGLGTWLISIGFVATLISFIRQQLKRRAVRISEEKANADKINIARKIEFVETEWDRIGNQVDKLRDDK